jgi:dimethylamine/trimethylamine dehydrogenase
MQAIPIRRTQNPSIGEEWRRGWRPEALRPKTSDARILIVGAGPAGLEAALGLGLRGHEVLLAEASRELGGRARREAMLPGLSTYARVADWREGQIAKLDAVQVFRESRLGADDIAALDVAHVAIATGAAWRRDGAGRAHPNGLCIAPEALILTPDDVLDGAAPTGDVFVYDDDHGHLASAIAERLARAGARVTFATPAPLAAYWTQVTLEQMAIARRLVQAGVSILTRTRVAAIAADHASLIDDVTGAPSSRAASAFVLATGRAPNVTLHHELKARMAAGEIQLNSLDLIGDACAPSLIANAVFAGRAYAEDFGEPRDRDLPPFARLPDRL